jgi:plasmid stabilization system protein ParE
VIGLTARAERQVAALRKTYEEQQRPEATRALILAILAASDRIEADPAAGLAAPRPYPQLARRGRLWVKAGRYWVAYLTTNPPVIANVFYDAADIPGRDR